MPEEKLIITVEDRNGISEIATMANMVVYGNGSRPISRYFIHIFIFLYALFKIFDNAIHLNIIHSP